MRLGTIVSSRMKDTYTLFDFFSYYFSVEPGTSYVLESTVYYKELETIRAELVDSVSAVEAGELKLPPHINIPILTLALQQMEPNLSGNCIHSGKSEFFCLLGELLGSLLKDIKREQFLVFEISFEGDEHEFTH